MKDSTRDNYEERLLRASRYLEDHLDEAPSLEDLARVACFSPFHFSRVYTAMTGETVMATHRRLRLERAASALRYGDRPITELAFEAGYETLEAFGRGFRKLSGMNPSTYRSRFRFGSGEGFVYESKARSIVYQPYGDKPVDVTIQTFPTMTVAYVRHVGPYQDCGSAWQKLCSQPKVMECFRPDTLAIGICYDDPDITEPAKIRMDACITVPKDFQAPEGVAVQAIEGGEFAVARHVGSYNGLHSCYHHLYGVWLAQSGREPKSCPTLEIYRNSPEHVPEDQLITDICIPLK